MKKVSMDLSGQFNIHMPLDEIGETADEIIETCMSRYSESHPEINTEDSVYFDFRVIYTSGLDNPEYSEFMAEVYIWQKSDDITGNDTCENYDDFHLSLSYEEEATIKQLIMDKMESMLFQSIGKTKSVA